MENNQLKILVINYEFPPLGGGGGVATYDLAIEWVKKARVDVLTSSFKGLKSSENVNDINVHRVKVLFRKSRDAASFISMLSYLPVALIKGFFLIRKNRYDAINTHFTIPSGPVGYILGKLFRIPNILSLHGGDIYDPSKKMSPHDHFFFKRAVKFILNRADYVVAQSSNTRDNAIKYYNPTTDISIIPLPFQPFTVPSITRKEVEISENDYILVSIGRLVKRKSIDTIITAISKSSKQNLKLYILGDGPEKDYLSMISRNLGVEDKIVFMGYVDEDVKYKILSVADLFVLPSMHEGFGIVYMEAMYCGLPIVCSNNGGQVDFLVNDENAILINVKDDEGCKKAIEKYYDNKEFYNKCSKNNLKKIKGFSAEAVADSYIDIFKGKE